MEQNTKLFEIAQTSNGVNNQIGTMNNNVNCNNKFNINVFLNETCKDAINLTDFVNQITLSLEDLEETSKVGYAEGISNVFIRNLKDIDYKQRPIHCNDYKREVLYIKSSKEEQQKNYNKIIKNISKEVIIDKDMFA
jgi:hypothetical protein